MNETRIPCSKFWNLYEPVYPLCLIWKSVLDLFCGLLLLFLEHTEMFKLPKTRNLFEFHSQGLAWKVTTLQVGQLPSPLAPLLFPVDGSQFVIFFGHGIPTPFTILEQTLLTVCSLVGHLPPCSLAASPLSVCLILPCQGAPPPPLPGAGRSRRCGTGSNWKL